MTHASSDSISFCGMVGALLARSRSIRQNVEESLREVGDMARGLTGTIRVGSGATTAEYILPTVTRQLLEEAPDVRMDVVIGMNDVLRTQLGEGRLDVVVGPLASDDAEKFQVERFGTDAVVVAVAHAHPLTRGPVTPADLLQHGWVLPARSVATRQWIDAAFASRGLPEPTVTILSNNLSLSPRLVAATDLVTFISRRNLGPGTVGLSLVEVVVPELTMHRPVGVVMSCSSYSPPLIDRFVRLLSLEARLVLER